MGHPPWACRGRRSVDQLECHGCSRGQFNITWLGVRSAEHSPELDSEGKLQPESDALPRVHGHSLPGREWRPCDVDGGDHGWELGYCLVAASSSLTDQSQCMVFLGKGIRKGFVKVDRILQESKCLSNLYYSQSTHAMGNRLHDWSAVDVHISEDEWANDASDLRVLRAKRDITAT